MVAVCGGDVMTALADCCPACLDMLPVAPWSVIAVSAESVRADYLCGACGHTWFACWNPVALAALEVTA